MLNFFEKRWRQLVATNVCENKTVQAINTLQEAPEEGDSYIETEEEEEEVEIEDSSEMETSSSDSENSDTNNESEENMQWMCCDSGKKIFNTSSKSFLSSIYVLSVFSFTK